MYFLLGWHSMLTCLRMNFWRQKHDKRYNVEREHRAEVGTLPLLKCAMFIVGSQGSLPLNAHMTRNCAHGSTA